MMDDIPTFNGGGDKAAAAAAARMRRQAGRDALDRMRARATVERGWREERICAGLDRVWREAVASFRARHEQPTEGFRAVGKR